MRTDFAYFIGGAETPTLERVRYVVVAAAGAHPADWDRSETALLDRLSRALAIPTWRNRDGERIGIGRDRVVIATKLAA